MGTASEVTSFPLRLVDREELADDYGIRFSNQHLLRLEAAGQFPKRVYLTTGRVLWQASEIEAHIAERLAQRGTASVHTIPEQHRHRRTKAA